MTQPVEPQPAEIRAWARSRGLVVPMRGRVPESIVRLYQEAHAQANEPAPAPTPPKVPAFREPEPTVVLYYPEGVTGSRTSGTSADVTVRYDTGSEPEHNTAITTVREMEETSVSTPQVRLRVGKSRLPSNLRVRSSKMTKSGPSASEPKETGK